ncbi:hypothetical protein AYO38_07710 [bacterium SCGC AG-212-C10]|nr:hypothetical protein AYO38_07710 [bacterium SCGC AG-212-C10]
MRLRIRQIALVAEKLAPVVEDFHEVLGVDVCYRDPGVGTYGLENALMPIGNELLEVVAPIKENTAGGRYLERRNGDGGYMVITQCDENAPRRKRINELGIRLVSDFHKPGEFTNMQLHPKDTGGSFFEIDEQLGERAYEPDGPWDPAGHEWSKFKTGLATGIVAAEVQCDDPAATAARWSEIAEVALTKDGAGNAVLPLEGNSVRFVPISDGRPEGLGGIDVKVTDKAKVLAAAKARGAYRSDDQVYLCGMRINLV